MRERGAAFHTWADEGQSQQLAGERQRWGEFSNSQKSEGLGGSCCSRGTCSRERGRDAVPWKMDIWVTHEPAGEMEWGLRHILLGLHPPSPFLHGCRAAESQTLSARRDTDTEIPH